MEGLPNWKTMLDMLEVCRVNGKSLIGMKEFYRDANACVLLIAWEYTCELRKQNAACLFQDETTKGESTLW